MNIDIYLVENAVNSIVKTTLDQLRGNLSPVIATHEAIEKLGTISALVITLHDESKSQGCSDELLNRIWELKKKCDDNLLKLFLELS